MSREFIEEISRLARVAQKYRAALLDAQRELIAIKPFAPAGSKLPIIRALNGIEEALKEMVTR